MAPGGKGRVLRLAAAVILVGLAVILAMRSGTGIDLPAWRIVAGGALMLANCWLSPVRLVLLARAFGHRLTPRQAGLAIASGFFAGAFGLSLAGQAGGAVAVMRASGIPLLRAAGIFAAERAIGLATLAALAGAGATALYGPPPSPLAMLAGGFAVLAALIATAPDIAEAAERIRLDLRWAAAAAGLTALMQACCLAAWVALVDGMDPARSAAAAALVMFASAVPVGFAGFGPREVAAVAIFGGTGIAAATALASSALIGAASLGAVTAMGLWAIAGARKP